MRGQAKGFSNRNRGFLFLTALFVVTGMLSLTLLGLSRSVIDLRSASWYGAEQRAFHLAEAGVDEAIMEIEKGGIDGVAKNFSTVDGWTDISTNASLCPSGKTCKRKTPFLTGEANMSHTIANLEFHHFKYDGFRRPGDLHVHFFGTGTLSIADGIATENGDEFEIEATVFGAPLRNRLKAVKPRFKPDAVKAL